jgi:type IV fimbrial biogenesis protein FimT
LLMGFFKTKSSGFTLLELMITVAIIVIITAIALPSFRSMIKNAQTRNAAEAITNGLQKARAEAVARNANVEFVLGAASSWQVKLPGSTVIESRVSGEGSADTAATAVATTATFNSFGGVVANADGSAILAQVDLATAGGTQPLRVTLGVGGNARMCDPNLTTGSSPRAC